MALITSSFGKSGLDGARALAGMKQLTHLEVGSNAICDRCENTLSPPFTAFPLCVPLPLAAFSS